MRKSFPARRGDMLNIHFPPSPLCRDGGGRGDIVFPEWWNWGRGGNGGDRWHAEFFAGSLENIGGTKGCALTTWGGLLRCAFKTVIRALEKWGLPTEICVASSAWGCSGYHPVCPLVWYPWPPKSCVRGSETKVSRTPCFVGTRKKCYLTWVLTPNLA